VRWQYRGVALDIGLEPDAKVPDTNSLCLYPYLISYSVKSGDSLYGRVAFYLGSVRVDSRQPVLKQPAHVSHSI